MADISNLCLNTTLQKGKEGAPAIYEYDYLPGQGPATAPPAPEPSARRGSTVAVGNFKFNDACAGGAADDDVIDDDINPYTEALRDGDVGAFFRRAQTLHTTLKHESPSIIKDRRYHLRTYKACFRGTDLVDWLTRTKVCATRIEATGVGSSLLLHGIIHHAVDDHGFSDNGFFYRFRTDDTTAWLLMQPDYPLTAQLAVRLHSYLGCSDNSIIANRAYGITTFKLCFVGSCMVTFLVKQGVAADRAAALGLCKRLQSFGFINHVADDHGFKDEYLFYRFYADTLTHDPAFVDFTRVVTGLCFLGHIRANLLEHDPWERSLKGLGAKYVLSEDALAEVSLAKASGAGEAGEADEFDGFGGFGSEAVGSGSSAHVSMGSFKRARLGTGFLFGDLDPRTKPGYKSTQGTLAHRGYFDEAKGDAPRSGQGDIEASALSQHDWYHGDIKREAIASRFQKAGNANGSWLVRRYRKKAGWCVLSECCNAVVYHVVIQNEAQQGAAPRYRIVPGPAFESVSSLCTFYRSNQHDELPTLLTTPVPVSNTNPRDFC